MERSGKHDDLRKNENVMRWYRNLEQGAKITADVYIRTLGLYCKENRTDPLKIVEDARSGKLRIEFMDFVHRQIGEGKAGSYILRFKKIISSWVKFNSLEAHLAEVKIRGSNVSPTVMNERVPQKDELKRILRMATTRAKAIIGLLAFSGLRPESLGNYDGSDAIRIRDVEGLSINGDHVEFSSNPAVLRIRQSVKAQLSKKGHAYIAFIPKQGMDYIKDYLDYRIKIGEKLSLESPVITVDLRGNQHRKLGDTMSTAILTRDVRDAIRNAGFSWRPYVMRAYFSSALDVCEAKGLVSHNWREFWHGYQGDISARYSTNKVLPEDTVNTMRETYHRCEPYLVTEMKEITQDDVKKGFRIEFLSSVMGYSQDRIDQLDLASMSNEEFQNLVKNGILGNITGNGSRQKIVSEKEIEKYMNDGYEVFTTLPSGKIVMKLPS
jgi:integrase